MSRKVTVEIEAINNTKKAIQNAIKQLGKLTKSVDEQQKAQQKGSNLTKLEIAAYRKLAQAMKAQKLDQKIAQLEKEFIKRGKLIGAISKQGKAAEAAAKREEQASKQAYAKKIVAEQKAAKIAIKLATKVAEAKVSAARKGMRAEVSAAQKTITASQRQRAATLKAIQQRRNAHDKLTERIARNSRKASVAAEKAAKRTATANRRAGLSFNSVGKAAMRLFFIYEAGIRAVRMLVTVMVKPFAEAIKSFMAFESGMAEVSTLLGKDIGEEGQKAVMGLTNSVKDLSIEFGKAPVDMAKALYFAVSAGATNAADAQKVLRASTMLATAGLVDAETSTRALVTVMNAFGIEYEKAEAVSDQFFITVQKGITTVKELANKIGRVAGMAGAAGMSMQTMFAFIAAGTKVTGLTTATVTGLRSAINLILKPGKTAREVFDRLKITYGKSAIAGEGLANLIKKLRARVRGLTVDGNKLNPSLKVTSEDLARMIPNMRASAVMMALLKSRTDEFNDILITLNDKNKTAGATAAAVAKIMETLAFKVEKLKSAFEVVKIEFGGNFAEIMQLGSLLEGMTESLITIFEAFKKIGDEEDIMGARDMQAAMKGIGEGLVFIVFDIGIELIKFMGRVATWIADLRSSAAWALQLTGGPDLTATSKELQSVQDIIKETMVIGRTGPLGVFGMSAGDIKGLREDAADIRTEGSNLNRAAKNFLNDKKEVKKIMLEVRAEIMKEKKHLRSLSKTYTKFGDAQEAAAKRMKVIKNEMAKLVGPTKDNVENVKKLQIEYDGLGNRIGMLVNRKTDELQATRKSVRLYEKTGKTLLGQTTKVSLLEKAERMLSDRLQKLTRSQRDNNTELERNLKLAGQVETTWIQHGHTLDRLREAYIEVAAARARGEDISGISDVLTAQTIERLKGDASKDGKTERGKMAAEESESLIKEYAIRYNAFIEYVAKEEAFNKKAAKINEERVSKGLKQLPFDKRPPSWFGVSGATDKIMGMDVETMPSRQALAGEDAAAIQVMLDQTKAWAKGDREFLNMMAGYRVSVIKGMSKDQVKAWDAAVNRVKQANAAMLSLEKAQAVALKKLRQKTYDDDLDGRDHVMKMASKMMHKRLREIEQAGYGEVRAKREQLLAIQGLIKNNFPFMAEADVKAAAQTAISAYETIPAELIRIFGESIPLQLKVIEESRDAYTKLADFIKASGKGEVEQKLLVEGAKLKIIKEFGDKYGKLGAKFARAGIKQSENLNAEAFKASIDAQVYVIQASRKMYTEMVAVIEANAKNEVEITLRKEQAKLQIQKHFSDQFGALGATRAGKGIAMYDKELKGVGRSSRKWGKKFAKEGVKLGQEFVGNITGGWDEIFPPFEKEADKMKEAWRQLGIGVLDVLIEIASKELLAAITSAGLKAGTTAKKIAMDKLEMTSSKVKMASIIKDEQAIAAARIGSTASGAGTAASLAPVAGAAGGLAASTAPAVAPAIASAGMSVGAIAAVVLAVVALIGIAVWNLFSNYEKAKEADDAYLTRWEAGINRKGQRGGQPIRPGGSGWGNPFYASGGLVTGGIPGIDSVPILAQQGEYVLPKHTVDSIRQGAPPSRPGRYAHGGFVSSAGVQQIVFAPQIQTIALPDSTQNQRYYRDTVAKTRNKLAKTFRGV